MSNQAFYFFWFKDPIPKDLISGVVYKFQCGLCNESYYDESFKHLHIRSEEHIDIKLSASRVNPVNNSAARDHLLHFNYLPFLQNLSIATYENKMILFKIKKNLQIVKGKPSIYINELY